MSPAAFELAAEMPGVEVRTGVTDLLGRAGVMVTMPGAERSGPAMVFDPATYEWLGTWRPIGKEEVAQSSVLRVAVVDRAGDLPDLPRPPVPGLTGED